MDSESPTKTVTFDGRVYTLDEHGFLDPPEQWDEAFARGMAPMQGIYDGLTEPHWSFLRYLRRKLLEERTVPTVVAACQENKLRLAELRQLFPTGYHRGACRMAGINFDFMFETNYWLTYESRPPPEFRVDALGFLERFEDWNERFAQRIAHEWGLAGGLTDRHRKVIAFLRDAYRVLGTIPSVYETCRAHDLSLDDLRTLFPEGYRRGACRMAGLPFFG